MKEIIIEHVEETYLPILSNEIQAIFTKNSTRTGCRVYKKGNIGIAGCVGEANTDKLFDKAEHFLDYQIDYPVEPTTNIESHVKIDKCTISDNELYSESEKILKELAGLHPDFIVNNNISSKQYEISIKNELGMDLSYFDRYINIFFGIKQKGSLDKIDTYFIYRSRGIESEKIIKASSEVISAYSKLLPFPKEPLPLIVDSYLVTKIFNTELRADVLGTGTSLFQNQIGKEIFSKNFSLKLNNNYLDTYREIFDMEGTITPEKLSFIIKDGVIIRPFSDKRTSKKYGYENTGCASGCYNSVPTLRDADLKVQPGKKTLKELLSGQMGILIYLAGGGDFTPDGNYATPVQLAYLTDGEKLLGRLPNFTIKSSIYDIFGKDFIGMSKEKLFLMGNNNMLVTKMDIKPL